MPLSHRTAVLLALPVLLTACSRASPAPAAPPTPPPATPSHAGGVSATVPGGKTRWIKMPKLAVAPMPDAVAARLASAATGLVETTPGTFTGSVPEKIRRDLRLFAADIERFALADPPAKPVRWATTGTITMRLDAQGRLSGLAIEVPSADGSRVKKLSLTYSDYGRVGRPSRPAGKDVLELPAFPR